MNMLTTDTQGGGKDFQTADALWQRYKYGCEAGHNTYIDAARQCENFYLGGGLQWETADLQRLKEAGRPAFEFNQIAPKVNTAIGYQVQNRMDIAFRPRGGNADGQMAQLLSKIAMQVANNTGLHWKETQVFSDGLIQQRGYFDIRISYEDSILGEVRIETLDPMDVIPDPDARSYDPDDWQDVIVCRWYTLDEIESYFGAEKRKEIEYAGFNSDTYGNDDERNTYGDDHNFYYGNYQFNDGCRRAKVIERQYWKLTRSEVGISPTGDIRIVEGMDDNEKAKLAQNGYLFTKKKIKRVRWAMAAQGVLLFDDWSDYNHFTVVPYFPFFRRGKTRGLIDNSIGPQQMLNKSLSQYMHIINSSANGGWVVWSNTMANMREEEIEERGAETGLTLVMKNDTDPSKVPYKIQPNPVPSGIDRIIDRSTLIINETTGINQAMQGTSGPEVSGIAIQSRQFAAQQQLAVPLDNLGYTRRLLAGRMLELIQGFYDEPRVIRITETDSMGNDVENSLEVNQPVMSGGIFNDLTIGEYDVVISESPMQTTFDNNQFNQILEMMDKGVPIPPQFLIRFSNLSSKQEIIDAMAQQSQVNPIDEAKAQQILAQTEKYKADAEKSSAEAVNKRIEALYSAVQTGGVVAQNPGVASIADGVAKSGGFKDQNQPPIIGVPEQAQSVDIQNSNTNPLTPANPGVGLQQGIRTPDIDMGV